MTVPADNTPIGIITDAMQDAGLLSDGSEPNSDQLAKYMRRLRDIINLWQTQGLKLWLQVDTPVTLTAGLGTYSFAPGGTVNMVKPLRALQGYYTDSTGNIRRPIYPMSRDEFMRLSNVTQQGQISQYFVDKQQTQLVVTFWLIPDATAATGTAHLLLQTQATNPVNLTETVNFPNEWRIALRWGLADDICTGQPQAIMSRCAEKALIYRSMLEDWDVEDAPTKFEPDTQGATGGSFV